MRTDERQALAAVSVNWAPTPDDLWKSAPFHVDGLHPRTVATITDGIAAASNSTGSSPLGITILGQRGAGKTHLLGWVREQVQTGGGYFFLIGLLDATAFWRSTAMSILDGLMRTGTDNETQLQKLLHSLCALTGTPRHSRTAVVGETPLTRAALDSFIEALRTYDRHLGLECQDTARALALFGSASLQAQDIGYSFLCSFEEEEHGERSQWGIRRGSRSAQQIVQDISKLLAMTGPTIMAIDQIDTLIAQSAKSTGDDTPETWRQGLLLEQIAGGLMSLREVTRRTLSIVACLPLSWELITTIATDSVRDRFREAERLRTIPSAEVGRDLIAKRFAHRYSAVGFDPPYPTWPVAPQAFAEAPNFTPRQLLVRVDAHIRNCLLVDDIAELTSMEPEGRSSMASQAPLLAIAEQDLDAIDVRFGNLKTFADVMSALTPAHEDDVMPSLIAAGLTAWIAQLGVDGRPFSLDPPPAGKPALHARLRQTLDEAIEDEVHWSFRAISAESAASALNRIRLAATVAGLDAGIPKRQLFLLRNTEWSRGARTREALEAFNNAGGKTLIVDAEDLRVLHALRQLFDERPGGLDAWLLRRRPAQDIKFLQAALSDAETTASQKEVTRDSETVTGAERLAGFGQRSEPAQAPMINIGRTADGSNRVNVLLETLRSHVAILAGSGSGKTVLIRRIIEECALKGVSSIVLDPNNDLARLGDPWPTPPATWGPEDRAKAAKYIANTDVVVWTPRRAAGRPIGFPPLPDFSRLTDEPDEFDLALDVAVASLATRIKADNETAKGMRARAVLREALAQYVRGGGQGIKGFSDMLSDLPDRVSTLEGAGKIAFDMAQSLTAATINDPVFAGADESMDPGELLTPRPGKRARVSVISFVGLPSDDQRQTFVSQLQMALFTWIKQHPPDEGPLRGLFVMDEAQTLVPSGSSRAASTQSTLALASQGRRYGLGLVFATQAPKALHNRVAGNSATQLFGLLNSPIQIATAREMAQVKGGEIPDISRLATGQFYATIKGSRLDLMRSHLCLSHHPRNPMTTEEVITRAREMMIAPLASTGKSPTWRS